MSPLQSAGECERRGDKNSRNSTAAADPSLSQGVLQDNGDIDFTQSSKDSRWSFAMGYGLLAITDIKDLAQQEFAILWNEDALKLSRLIEGMGYRPEKMSIYILKSKTENVDLYYGEWTEFVSLGLILDGKTIVLPNVRVPAPPRSGGLEIQLRWAIRYVGAISIQVESVLRQNFSIMPESAIYQYADKISTTAKARTPDQHFDEKAMTVYMDLLKIPLTDQKRLLELFVLPSPADTKREKTTFSLFERRLHVLFIEFITYLLAFEKQ